MDLQLVSNEPEVVRLRVSGKLSRDPRDTGSDPLASLCGANLYEKQVLLDLGAVEYIDSTGVEWLLGCHARCEKNQGALVLHTLSPLAADLMKIMRMDLVLHVAPNGRKAEEMGAKLSSPNGNHSDGKEGSHGTGD